MVSSFNFELNNSKTLSKSCLGLGLKDFKSVCNHIKLLPYGRNSDRSNFELVLKEHKGTCSTKHAFLKQLAIEQNVSQIQLFLGIYKMQESNTNGVAAILSKYNLEYIPEAHTYLKYYNEILDFTRSIGSEINFKNSLILEKEIFPKDIGDYKLELHKRFIKNWIEEENIAYSFNDIWQIREACIKELSV